MTSLLDRIERVSIDTLKQYPGNPRIGNVEAIAESLQSLDQFAPLIVQRSTNYILAGNHTHQAAEYLGWDEIDVVYIDVDSIKAKRIVLAANRTADLGTYDERLLLDLLSDIALEEDALFGTGYTTEDVDALLDAAVDFELPDDYSGEGAGDIASVFDKIMPKPTEDRPGAPDKHERKGFKPNRSTVGTEVTEFVIFRFGELQAKVPKATYDEFVRGFLREHDGDLSLAGVGAAAMLGLPTEDIEPAIAVGTERWL